MQSFLLLILALFIVALPFKTSIGETGSLSAIEEKALAGDVQAQFELGIAYHSGRGTSKDNEQYLFWITKSAEGGYAAAQYQLANIYHAGYLVEKDTGAAKDLMAKAAEQGYLPALRRMCRAFEDENGKKDQPDFDLPSCLKLAAHENNYEILGRIYEEGIRTPQDLVEAYFWYSLTPDTFVRFDAVTLRMSEAQITQAEKLIETRKQPIAREKSGAGVFCLLYILSHTRDYAEKCPKNPNIPQDMEQAFFWLTLVSNNPLLDEISRSRSAALKKVNINKRNAIHRRGHEFERESGLDVRQDDYETLYHIGKKYQASGDDERAYYWLNKAEMRSPRNEAQQLWKKIGKELAQEKRLAITKAAASWTPQPDEEAIKHWDAVKELDDAQPEKTEAFLKKTAHAGLTDAQFRLGKMYYEGDPEMTDEQLVQRLDVPIQRIIRHAEGMGATVPSPPSHPVSCGPKETLQTFVRYFKTASDKEIDQMVEDVVQRPGPPSLNPCF